MCDRFGTAPGGESWLRLRHVRAPALLPWIALSPRSAEAQASQEQEEPVDVVAVREGGVRGVDGEGRPLEPRERAARLVASGEHLLREYPCLCT